MVIFYKLLLNGSSRFNRGPSIVSSLIHIWNAQNSKDRGKSSSVNQRSTVTLKYIKYCVNMNMMLYFWIYLLVSDDSVVFNSSNLSSLNILELYNKHITSLSPSEPQIGNEKTIEEEKKKKKSKNRVRITPGSKHRGVFL